MSINGAENNVFCELGHHGLEEKAVFALTQLMTLYLNKGSSEKERIGRETPAPLFRKGREFEIEARPNSAPWHTIGLLDHHRLPGALRNEMRAIGATLYEKTNSTEAMSDVLYRVMENFPNQDLEVVGVLDEAFNGIGGWWA